MRGFNQHLLKRLAAIQQALMAQKAAGGGLPSAMAGTERESFVRDYLQTVFPAHRRFTSGVLTDAAGGLSGQVDIAVEYGHCPSFPMPASDERLLLAESVAMVIEVKSDLASQWDEVEATTKKVKALTRELGAVMTVGGGGDLGTIPVVAVGYAGHKTSAGLIKRLSTTGQDSRPDAALVIQSGCFSGYGLTAHGPVGLYALTVAINHELGRVAVARPNLLAYVLKPEDDEPAT